MLNDITIRPMHSGELEAVAKLFYDVWHETQRHLQDPKRGKFRYLGFFQNRIHERKAHTLVAANGIHILGFACWTGGHFNSLFVAKEARSSGLGSTLLQAAEAEMCNSGVAKFELDCLVGNEAGRRFYERHGWHISGERYWEDETSEGPAWARAWVMEKSCRPQSSPK